MSLLERRSLACVAQPLARVSFGVLLVACSSSGSSNAPTIEPRLSVIEQRIFQPSCTFSSCHGADPPKAGLNLTGSTYAQLVQQASTEVEGRVRVIPSDPEGSYLMEKLTDDTPTSGTRMPYSSSPLAEEKIAAIRRWIELGAQDD